MPQNRHEIAISRLSTLLEHISVQAKQTDQLNSKQKSHRLIENNNLFSQHLFTTESDKIFIYVEEVKKRLNEFSRLYALSGDNPNKAEFAKSSLQRIEQQISALMNAIQSNQTMHQAAQASFDARKNVRVKAAKAAQLKQNDVYNKMAKSVLLTSHQLYQQLSEHHEFERRLRDMITEREQQRIRSKSANTEKLSQEVLALHQRLGRCRKAISSIERSIEQAEKSKLR
ncbi:primosomal replication protein PriC [Colwellia psychrerythraea]|uniref:Putative primosomal replication protein N n=1 Tax=Colwellia psychrerythraea (strain 34H / ATCC BAA-681) TaxID=167879 RepID=Q47XP5_COLP3|nr:primosomal replication protein PriC [Colwellia psychrerythraea]AAZ28005.1 putative primosomal replication protein N'' [Colwellia psychrerythraea 34H]